MSTSVPRWALATCVLALALALPTAAAHAATHSPAQLYVSLGDSYAAGIQPDAQGRDRATINGFAYQLPKLAAARGYHLKLVNFGCGLATSTSILQQKGCPAPALGRHGVAYPTTTQATAAVNYLRRHRAETALITVAIGGNDVNACSASATPVACVGTAVGTINANVKVLLGRLRAAAGPKVRIVGVTYPDVILGSWLLGTPEGQQLAALSQSAFQGLINPALRALYTGVGGRFVDVTQATGGYVPLTDVVTDTAVAPTPVPTAVDRICRLTYFCQLRDIHPRTPGYAIIAQLVAGTLPRKG